MKLFFEKNVCWVFLFLLVFLASCVGTVKDQNAKKTVIQSAPSNTAGISFDGLLNANPVAHDKIELFFRPAQSSEKTIYEIFVNNSTVPIRVTEESLSLNSSGLLVFVVKGLQINTTYSFNMRAISAQSSSETTLDTNKSIYATTFGNETADFLGLSSAVLGAGTSGRDTVKLSWIEATSFGTSSINVQGPDPVAYEVTYISEVGGLANINNSAYKGLDRVVRLLPMAPTNPPSPLHLNQATISGLIPSTTYYFQVRAIHKNFVLYGSDKNYKREMNTRYIKIQTRGDVSDFDFNPASISLASAPAEAGMTSFDLSWSEATGSFFNYRVCYEKVADQTAAQAPAGDFLSDVGPIINNPSKCITQDASATSFRLSGLISYAYYQVKVIACKNAACTERIASDVRTARVVTSVAQFSGISTFLNPLNEDMLDTISLNFSPPLVALGYLTTMKLKCYSSLTDPNPVSIPTDGTASVNVGKPECDALVVTSPQPFPITQTDFSNFNNLSLKLFFPIDGTRTYCFALVPVIESEVLTQTGSANVKCFTPEIKTPSLVEFPGKIPACTSSTGKDLLIKWNPPTAGLYSKYILFYRKKIQGGTNQIFSFTDAVAAYKANDNSIYTWIDNIDKIEVSKTLDDLAPGGQYGIGVLSYLVNGSNKIFSEYNLSVDDCSLPYPIAKFSEWVDIFAVGPKEDGLTPQTAGGVRRFLLETLDDDGIPVEPLLQTSDFDEKTLDTSDPLSASRTGFQNFDGVYGTRNASAASTFLNQYSNSGIVRLAWEDVTTFNGADKFDSFVSLYEVANTPKKLRKYGYRVYRSDDNMMTWVDLTLRSSKNKFQTDSNSGLLHAGDYSWRKRNNASAQVSKVVFFTDYSVKFSDSSGEVDRGRVYWYRIVPVYNGKELIYSDLSNPNHHIVRVTLPPKNMALVHRFVANRAICLEMDRAIDKSASGYYSCPYGGIGASGLTLPWTVGNTVYDQGGDLLVDRFELSCPFTRGDVSASNSDSQYSGTKPSFKGVADNTNSFKGCFAGGNTTYEPNQGPSLAVNYKYHQVIPGDCFGRDDGIVVYSGLGVCLDPSKATGYRYTYPGSRNEASVLEDCTDPKKIYGYLLDPTKEDSGVSTDFLMPAQSELAAVYYLRSASSVGGATPGLYTGAGNSKITTTRGSYWPMSSCQVNLPYVTSGGNYRPRWIPLNLIFGGLRTSTNVQISLYDKTMNQILSSTNLYDSSSVIAPSASEDVVRGRFDPADTKLGRIMTSNSAKLPPINGIGQVEMDKICGLYKVQLGFEGASSSFIPLGPGVISKRLLRRKESVAASLFPQHYSSTKVQSIEQGDYAENAITKGCNGLKKNAVLTAGASLLKKGDNIAPNFPTNLASLSRVVSGSSSRIGTSSANSLSTEKCVSRFGIQDLIGNLSEENSDQIFCDYSTDKLYIGPQGDVTNSVEHVPSNWLDPNQFIPWLLSNISSGSCSLVERGADKTGIYLDGANMTSIENSSGPNTQVLKVLKSFDQNSVLSGRNGDGTFLDFGQNGLAVKLDMNNSFALGLGQGAKYFNPVLGIPLSCGNIAGCLGQGRDNSRITTSKIASEQAQDPIANPEIDIFDFPIGDSTFSNQGVSESIRIESYNTLDPNNLGTTYVTDLNLGDPLDPTDNGVVLGNTSPGSPPRVDRYDFLVDRGAALAMVSGGSSREDIGRYNLEIIQAEAWERESPSGSIGVRCAVLVNQDAE